jgi:hypothetical protein
MPFRGQEWPPAWLTALRRMRFQSLKKENVAAHAQVPAAPKKKILLPEIVPLNAVDYAINFKGGLMRLANRSR